jgi:hypothetical protein
MAKKYKTLHPYWEPSGVGLRDAQGLARESRELGVVAFASRFGE